MVAAFLVWRFDENVIGGSVSVSCGFEDGVRGIPDAFEPAVSMVLEKFLALRDFCGTRNEHIFASIFSRT